MNNSSTNGGASGTTGNDNTDKTKSKTKIKTADGKTIKVKTKNGETKVKNNQ